MIAIIKAEKGDIERKLSDFNFEKDEENELENDL